MFESVRDFFRGLLGVNQQDPQGSASPPVSGSGAATHSTPRPAAPRAGMAQGGATHTHAAGSASRADSLHQHAPLTQSDEGTLSDEEKRRLLEEHVGLTFSTYLDRKERAFRDGQEARATVDRIDAELSAEKLELSRKLRYEYDQHNRVRTPSQMRALDSQLKQHENEEIDKAQAYLDSIMTNRRQKAYGEFAQKIKTMSNQELVEYNIKLEQDIDKLEKDYLKAHPVPSMHDATRDLPPIDPTLQGKRR